jgi:hypothetical protein
VSVGSSPERAAPAYTNLARRTFPELEDLFAAGEHVRGLQAHPGWVYLSRLLEEAIAEIDFSLDGRLLESKSEYAHRHGQRHGLRAMWQAADAIVHTADTKLRQQQEKHEGAGESVPVGGYQ